MGYIYPYSLTTKDKWLKLIDALQNDLKLDVHPVGIRL